MSDSAPRTVGQVESETISIADEISVLEELLGRLEDRLRPITVPVPDNSIGGADSPEPDLVPLASILATQRRRLGRIGDQIQSITLRLEL